MLIKMASTATCDCEVSVNAFKDAAKTYKRPCINVPNTNTALISYTSKMPSELKRKVGLPE